jgi:uncharacterized protein (DUF4415 family)
MKRRQPVTKNESSLKRSKTRRGRRTRKPMDPLSVKERGLSVPLQMRIADFYRPLKKPVTLRLDADVIAWFKKDGRRYQTRINAALRKVMEKEMRASS